MSSKFAHFGSPDPEIIHDSLRTRTQPNQLIRYRAVSGLGHATNIYDECNTMKAEAQAQLDIKNCL